MKKTLLFTAFALMSAMISPAARAVTKADYNIIPLPAGISLKAEEGSFTLDRKTVITYPSTQKELKKEAEHLQTYLREATGLELKIESKAKSKNAINLQLKPVMENPEGYQLSVSPKTIEISSPSSAGVFYGIQTLRKSIPAGMKDAGTVDFPSAKIADYPRFGYRGAHFDIVRHYFPKDSVKKFIDLLALHNINRMHWHLTDDQGWRIEIKKYPKLTEIGSKRPGTMIGRNFSKFDTIPVEGFLTQEDIKEVIDYAADRHITIIPEIDLPGHMVAALTAYPELGCTGGPYEVWQKWGVSEDLLCAGKDNVYTFLFDVLDEVSDLFPSEYIHIGGDECPKVRWEECVLCQAKIAELGLKSDEESSKEEKLQSHVMTQAENFLAGKGKKIIGWDEILEGGVSPTATIMSWRGEAGGLKAAGMGHDVIMTPNNYLYFDYYQTLDKDNEPIAMNGYVPLEKVYSYEPVPASFTPEQAARIKGVQANLWTEYIKTFPHAIYMELPRMAALSEVQWTEGNKDYDKFMERLPAMLAIYAANDYPYSLRAYDVTGNVTVDPATHTLALTLNAPEGAPIHYTLDGSDPGASSPVYTSPISVDKDTKVRARAFYSFGESNLYRDSVSFNKATARPVTLLTPPAPKFAREPLVLTDGQRGGDDWKADSWMGYHGTDAEVVIDLLQPVEISQVATNSLVDTPSHVFDMRKMSVSVSDDGQNWTQVGEEDYPELTSSTRKINTHAVTFAPVKARYVKVAMQPEKSIPEWHPAKGNKGFLFIDEISVE